jgi:hypothetical protein
MSLIRRTQEINLGSKMKNMSINFAIRMSINIEILITVVCGTHNCKNSPVSFAMFARLSHPLVTTILETLNKF